MDLSSIFNASLQHRSKPYGITGGILEGEDAGYDLATKIQILRAKQAEQSRYEQETPLELNKRRLSNESTKLSNLPGQAKEAAGVYPAEAQQQALIAQQALQTLPKEQIIKMQEMTKKQTDSLLTALKQHIMTSGDVVGAFSIIEQQVPGVTKDASWNMTKRMYGNASPQEALDAIKKYESSFASSEVYANPEFQRKAILGDIEHQREMEKIAAQGKNALSVATARGPANETQHALIVRLAQEAQAAARAGDKKKETEIWDIINAIKAVPTTVTESSIAGTPLGTKEQTKRLGPAQANPGTAENPIKLDSIKLD
jgi:hypothetical protein